MSDLTTEQIIALLEDDLSNSGHGRVTSLIRQDIIAKLHDNDTLRLKLVEVTERAMGLEDQYLIQMLIADQAEAILDLLLEVSRSGVEFSDPRISYVTVQIDSGTWDEIQKLRAALEGKNENGKD